MSSKKNRKIREELERIYGKGCMFQKAKVEKRIEEIGGIKTYKQFKEQHRFTLKRERVFENMMTYHHLKHLSEGGETTIENGAVVGSLPHMYMHSLPREQEEVINDMLRNFKECKVVYEDFEPPIKIKIRELSIDKRGRLERRDKNEMQKLKKEWEDRWNANNVNTFLATT